MKQLYLYFVSKTSLRLEGVRECLELLSVLRVLERDLERLWCFLLDDVLSRDLDLLLLLDLVMMHLAGLAWEKVRENKNC